MACLVVIDVFWNYWHNWLFIQYTSRLEGIWLILSKIISSLWRSSPERSIEVGQRVYYHRYLETKLQTRFWDDLAWTSIQSASSARPIRGKTIDWLKARAEISYLFLMWIKSPKLGKCVKLVFNFRALKSKYIKLRPVQLFNTSTSPLVKWCHRHFWCFFLFLL